MIILDHYNLDVWAVYYWNASPDKLYLPYKTTIYCLAHRQKDKIYPPVTLSEYSTTSRLRGELLV